jgi:NAD(P)H-flavin reductase
MALITEEGPTETVRVDPMVPVRYRVVRTRRETHDTFTLELVPADGGEVMSFAPGQFNMLYAFGVGEVPISISGDPADRRALVHTVRAVGAVTRAMQRLTKGDVIGVRGPYGTPWPVEAAKGEDVVFMPGGIGLAPLRPALYHVLANRKEYGRVALVYGARTPGDILYRRELERWRARFDLEVEATVDRGAAGWSGDVGVVTTLVSRVRFDPINTIAMLCGPEIMMRFGAIELQKYGVQPTQIYVSMERNMQCAIGFCGHCQFGPTFVCKDGPVFRSDAISGWFGRREI